MNKDIVIINGSILWLYANGPDIKLYKYLHKTMIAFVILGLKFFVKIFLKNMTFKSRNDLEIK